MQTHVEFRSDRFPAYEDEEQQINPGRWGKRLAEFLRDNLRKEGFRTEEPIAEDWGWILPISNDQFRSWVGCGNYEEYPDGFLCFTQDYVASLQQAMDRILSDTAGIRDKCWWTYDEFNNSRK